MRTLELSGGAVVYSTDLGSRLARLAECFELVWATSREQHANDLAVALDLPRLPVIAFGSVRARRGTTWKLASVKAFAGERAIAWVDDEFGRDAHHWADTRPQPSMLLNVNPAWGLVERPRRNAAAVRRVSASPQRLISPGAHPRRTRSRPAARWPQGFRPQDLCLNATLRGWDHLDRALERLGSCLGPRAESAATFGASRSSRGETSV
jgi:hypothetical protein